MIKVFETEEALARTIAAEMREQIEGLTNPVFCLAAGNTASKCYQRFAEECGKSKEIRKLSFVSLDEWVGISGKTAGSCYQMLHEDLFQYLPVPEEQITFFDTVNNNLLEECRRIDTYIRLHPITFSLVGVGMNGHIGLNEPGTPVIDHSSIVPLSDTTKRVSRKYFEKETKVEEGITLGLKQIINSERVIVAVTGARKKDIVKEIVEHPESHLPAQELLGFPHIDFYFDQEAAGSLRQEFCK